MIIVVCILSILFLLTIPNIQNVMNIVDDKGCKALVKVVDAAIVEYK
ncbi:MAG: competence protein ComGC, partial [Erysipelotrichaceae bacterium]|nr:competence protein ComGC [Erysipelotrichaceae bacterium]